MKHYSALHLGDGVPFLCGAELNVTAMSTGYQYGNEYGEGNNSYPYESGYGYGYEHGHGYGDGNNSYPYGYNYHYDYGNESFPNEYDYEYTGTNHQVYQGPSMESVNCWRYEAISDSWAVSGR